MKHILFASLILVVACATAFSASVVSIIQMSGVPFSISMIDQPQEKPAKEQALQLDEQPTPIKKAYPKYPENARMDTLGGTVYLKAIIGKDGSVTSVTVLKSTNEIFNDAAIEALKQWTFKPPTIKGEPATAEVVVPFKFKLEVGKEKKEEKKEESRK
jgi:protein TonB